VLKFKQFVKNILSNISITKKLNIHSFKRYFRSILIWIFILYIIIGGLSLISKKYRIDGFINYSQSYIMKKSLLQKEKLIPLLIKNINSSSGKNLSELSKEIYNLDESSVFLFFNEKEGFLATPFGVKKNLLKYKKLKYLNENNSTDLILQNSAEIGLNILYPDTYFISKKIIINSENITVIIGAKKSAFQYFSDDLLKKSLHIDFIVILVFFVLYVLITIFAITPVFIFLKKFNLNSLNSCMFKSNKIFEFNHIRRLRLTLLKSFRKLEKFEAEKLEMMNSLIRHQNDIDTGKVVSQIIHDLKSPLSVFEELLHDKKAINNEEVYRKSNLALIKLHSLIESIRDPKNEKLLNKKNDIFDFNKLVSEISWFAQKRNSKMIVSPSLTTPIIFCDHGKLERCLQNLIRNAIYFCNSYCLVDWKINNNGELYIEVIDDGKGISSDIQDKIFDWRMTFNKLEGTGVGLTFVKFVANSHGGRISYFRRNGLTVFALTIPNILNIIPKLTQQNDNKIIQNSRKNIGNKNKVILLIENPLSYEKISTICWPNDTVIEYHNISDKVFDLSECFCIYTDTNSDIIEKALSLGISVVLHKSFYSGEFILKKVLQTRKK
jgi:signal transduction histidine kinase